MPPTAPVSELASLLDRLGPALMAEHGVPGVQAAVCLGGRVVVERAWGLADAASGSPVTSPTVFKACSNGKPLAALVAMRLVRDGVMTLDTPVWRYLNGWTIPPERCGGHDPGGITLRMLLSHQAGFGLRGFPQVDWSEARPPGPRALMDGWFGPEFTPRLVNRPGSTVAYCGDGLTLAQLAMEEATGRGFADLFDELVARPLRLGATWFGRRAEMADRIASCHTDAGVPEPRRYYPALAASGLYTRAAELARVYASLPALVGSDLAAEMVRPQTPAKDGWMFGLAFAVAASNGRRVFKHAGWNEAAWGAAEGVGPRIDGVGAGRDTPGGWPGAAGAVLSNSAKGKDVCLGLLGAITQWLTSKGV